MVIAVLWSVMPCSLLAIYQCFGGNCFLSLPHFPTLKMDALGSSETSVSS
jgi:hypothetical protein